MPLDVAVLCAIPLDERDWHGRAALSPCGDFVRFIAETRFGGDSAAAWTFFSDEAQFIERKLEIFAARGIAVRRRATGGDIAEAAARHKDVVVIAHWKGPDFLQGGAGDRLETWDSMLSADEFSTLFPAGFGGCAYMVVCTSTFLAETFRRRHPGALCICSRDPVRAGIAMAKLDAALALMAAEGLPMWRGLQKAGETIDSIA